MADENASAVSYECFISLENCVPNFKGLVIGKKRKKKENKKKKETFAIIPQSKQDPHILRK